MARTLKPGVYQITNLKNGKSYVGSSTINVHQRYNDHKSQLKTGIHPNIHLQRSYNKHGLEVFSFQVLEYCTNVLEREQFYMDALKPEYNIEVIAGNSAGTKRSEETCLKISKSKLGNKNRTGMKKTEEEIEAIRNTLKAGYRSGRISHPMEGKTHRPESIVLLKKAKQGNSIRRDHPTYTDFEKLDPITLVVLGTYRTARECIESVGRSRKGDASGILYACRNQTKAFGFKWRSKNVQVKSDELLETPTGTISSQAGQE